MGVSRDVLFDYTSPDYPESAMQLQTLIKFAEYLGKDRYCFCNEYHKFLYTVKTGDFLWKLGMKHGMTQKQFANFLGITLASYKKYEEGRGRLSLEVFEKLKDEIGEYIKQGGIGRRCFMIKVIQIMRSCNQYGLIVY